MLRIGHTYELAITRLWLKSEEATARKRYGVRFSAVIRERPAEIWNAENKVLARCIGVAVAACSRSPGRGVGCGGDSVRGASDW